VFKTGRYRSFKGIPPRGIGYLAHTHTYRFRHTRARCAIKCSSYLRGLPVAPQKAPPTPTCQAILKLDNAAYASCESNARQQQGVFNIFQMLQRWFCLFFSRSFDQRTRISHYTQGRRTKAEGARTKDPGPVGWHRMCGRSHRWGGSTDKQTDKKA